MCHQTSSDNGAANPATAATYCEIGDFLRTSVRNVKTKYSGIITTAAT